MSLIAAEKEPLNGDVYSEGGGNTRGGGSGGSTMPAATKDVACHWQWWRRSFRPIGEKLYLFKWIIFQH